MSLEARVGRLERATGAIGEGAMEEDRWLWDEDARAYRQGECLKDMAGMIEHVSRQRKNGIAVVCSGTYERGERR